MGRVLAGILEQAIDAREGERSEVLLEAATAAAIDTPTLEALLNPETRELPEESTLRRLVEAIDGDADAAVQGARADGDLLEGDDLGQGLDDLIAHGGRIIEAVGEGTKPGTKRYKVVVVRPGQGKGTGRRWYSARMLEANASNFGGVPIFFNHEDLPKIIARGHGSRDPRDLAGWLLEATSWDPNYSEPDDRKNGRRKGAVVGEADFVLEAAELVDKLPQAVALSINMDSTRIRVGRNEDGKLVPLVEGVVPKSGSCDLITGEAGAGGKVLEPAAVAAAGERLREAAESRYGSGNADLAVIPDARLVEAVRSRPEVLAQLRDDDPHPDPEDRNVSGIDRKQLIEAVSDGDTATALVEALAGTPAFGQVVEARVAAREDEIRDETRAENQRTLDLRDMRDEAHRLVESHEILSRFPSFAESVRERYQLVDGRPTPALDVFPDVGDDGTTVTKAAIEKLRESVAADIERETNKLREAAPTRVQGLGGAAPEGAGGDGGGGDGNGNAEPPKDPTAERLGIPSDKVREYQGV